MSELPIHFEASEIEKRWYHAWEAAGCFKADPSNTCALGGSKDPFSIVIPPPNVTGVLHMGHALDNTLQDILCRYKRMDGFEVLWVPGTDHAGIATQMVVERQLAAKGESKEQLGRQAFEERIWAWKAESGSKITEQLRRLGASLDWSRERFTLDDGLSAAVRKVFVSLYAQNLIYRSDYLISWSPKLKTALSDLEVEYKEIQGTLTYFRYVATDGSFSVDVATTRPETILGDTALAVHPDDTRYAALVGKEVQHPFSKRSVRIIADEAVKPEFGTGVVKVTPAHDPTDYDMGKRHNLTFLTILDENACIDAPETPFHGMDRFAARKAVVAALKDQGLWLKDEPHTHAVGHCQRSGAVVEPRVSKQWFVRITDLATPALKAVQDGRTSFVPEHWTKTYVGWMENIRDWCISRQLWWGHRIPVWYCQSCQHENVSESTPTACQKCGSTALQQDPDVLDTWFSSALWPFSTMGWPEQTPDLKAFYPTSVLVTGFDIIFFWVARMMMMGLRFMSDVPFHTVHIHALVRDEHGQKMSKSKGNVVDPLTVMDTYGTDAFRFALSAFAIQGRDIPLSVKRIEGYRNFITKLWNASRFALSQGACLPQGTYAPNTLSQRWLTTRLDETIRKVRSALDGMYFNDAAEAIYRFVWNDVCDWYLEISKVELKDSNTALSAKETLGFVLDQVYRLLHPISPFVTEQLWQQLHQPKAQTFLMQSAYPKPLLPETFYRTTSGPSDDTPLSQRLTDASWANDVGLFEEAKWLIEKVRVFRSENTLAPSKRIETLYVYAKTSELAQKTQQRLAQVPYLLTLANVGELRACTEKTMPMPSLVATQGEVEIVVSLAGLVDLEAERKRLDKELAKAANDVRFLKERLASDTYRAKAPAHLIAKDEAKLAEAQQTYDKLQRDVDRLGGTV